MEKKGVRSGVPSSSKGVCTDSKKSQDNASGKLWPRGGRRREPVGGSGSSVKCESSRKPNPNQRVDKRPKPRGLYCSGPAGGKEEARLGERGAELGSVFLQGSKKQSLNHLLNFHYTPRENLASNTLYAHGRNSASHRWLSTQKHKYNKEQFLQANCQFVVNSNGDYSTYLNSPDTLVNWELIEQINVQVLQFPSCPICLYEPVAAKMTRCGHIYCWSCVLHYLALSDKPWRKCPICFESIQRDDLKSVVPIPHSTFNVGQTITFRLMKRARGCLTPMPVDQSGQRYENMLLPVSETAEKTMFCKLLLANNYDTMAIIDREQKQLQAQLIEDENAPEKCFIEQALALLSERQQKLNIIASNDEENSSKIIGVGQEPIKKVEHIPDNSEENFAKRMHLESISSEGLGSDVSVLSEDLNTCLTVEDLDISTSESTTAPSKHFYFYQALDGQHIYLHALNVRMLEHTYGSLEFSPPTVSGRIVEKEAGSMTEELRNRLRYLQHLPVTCQFEVAEVQLKPPIILKDTASFFQSQVDGRKRKRQQRAREERRREKRIAEEENKQMGKFEDMRASIDSYYQFPEFVANDTLPVDNTRSVSDLEVEDSAGGATAGPSFAAMLATSKPHVDVWPQLNSNGSAHAEPEKSLINMTKSTGSTRRLRTKSDSDPEPDGYVPAPAYNQSFSDAIAIAMEKACLGSENFVGEDSINQSGKKKKKKQKQKLLFATSMGYSG